MKTTFLILLHLRSLKKTSQSYAHHSHSSRLFVISSQCQSVQALPYPHQYPIKGEFQVLILNLLSPLLYSVNCRSIDEVLYISPRKANCPSTKIIDVNTTTVLSFGEIQLKELISTIYIRSTDANDLIEPPRPFKSLIDAILQICSSYDQNSPFALKPIHFSK